MTTETIETPAEAVTEETTPEATAEAVEATPETENAPEAPAAE